MENAQKAVKSEEALDTKALLNSLPENAEQRPKYVQILKQENGRTPIKSPAAPKAVPEASPAKNPAQSGGPKKKNNPKFFNKNRKNNVQAPEGQQQDGKRPFKVFFKKQEVIALPSTVAVREIPISTDNVNFFNGPTNYLSALHPSKIVIETNHYNSVEHYYQACKIFSLVGTVAAEKLNKISTPMEVKQETKKILREAKVSGKKVAEWREKDGVAVLKHAILHKFQQNEELKEKLLATDDKLLIQTFLGDTFFAAGATNRFVNGWVLRHTNQSLKYPQEIITENVKYLPLVANGKNVLGWILMGVREELRIASTA